MALETATYLNQLNAANPTGADPKNKGDDHLRLLKAVLLATFPNLSAAVNATPAELNKLVGMTATTAELNRLVGLLANAAQLNILNGATITTAELNRLAGVTSPIQTQINTEISDRTAADALKAPLNSPALTGVPTAPTAATGTNTTQLATTAFVQQAAFSSALPPGVDGSFLSFQGGVATWAQAPNQIIRLPLSSAYTMVFTDRASMAACTGTFTLSLDPAATLGNGWFAYVRNNGTGLITIDPNGAETIDGAATAVLHPGEVRLIYGDGATFYTVQLAPGAAGVLNVQRRAASSASAGQSVPQNAQTTVALDTVVTNTITGASLASNAVTLPAGSYEVEFSVPAALGVKVSLYNNTAAAVAVQGSVSSSSGTAIIRGAFVLAVTSSLMVRAYTSSSATTVGAGLDDGNFNVGANLYIKRLA